MIEALTFMAVEENVIELSAILVQAFASFYLRCVWALGRQRI